MIDVQYFGIFDGHAGAGAALMAADQLINHLQACIRGGGGNRGPEVSVDLRLDFEGLI